MTVASAPHASSTLGAAPAGEGWRWDARRVLAELRDQLEKESPTPYADGWLAARGGRVGREHALLLRRLGMLASRVQDQPWPVVHAELRRLREDVERHRQRARDLHWDAVELELGGSE